MSLLAIFGLLFLLETGKRSGGSQISWILCFLLYYQTFITRGVEISYFPLLSTPNSETRLTASSMPASICISPDIE